MDLRKLGATRDSLPMQSQDQAGNNATWMAWRIQRRMRLVDFSWLKVSLAPTLIVAGCVATNPAPPPKPLPPSIASKPAAESRAPVESTALMNPGDEVDDNIWSRRPRNRLQPGQSTAPASPTPTRMLAKKGSASAADPVPGESATLVPGGEVAGGAAASGAFAGSATGSEAINIGESSGRPADHGAAASAASSSSTPTPLPPVPAPLPSAKGQAPSSLAGTTPRQAAPAESAPPPAKSAAGTEGQPVWSIALATFGGDDHRATAEAASRLFSQQVPELRGAVIRSTPSGSVVLWGEFDGPKDPRARPELDRLKQVVIGDGRPFTKAMLVRLEQFSEQELQPWDLRQVRRRYPKVRVLYTLQVAAWSDLGSGSMSFDEIRRSAEAHCRQLRTEGAEAWFHHDADVKTSIVTVGVFDHRAYDPQSTLFSPEVETLRRRYPNSLLNGAELLIKPDPNRPDFAVPQPSRLVEVPR